MVFAMAFGSIIWDLISRGPGSIQWGKALFLGCFGFLMNLALGRFRGSPGPGHAA